MMGVLTNPKMTIKDYLTAANGKFSIENLSAEPSAGKRATNDVSESGHASSTAGLKTCGTIRLDHARGMGQSRANGDFGREARKERDPSEASGEGINRYEEWQQTSMPEINGDLFGFRVEFLFKVDYTQDTNSELVWRSGKVIGGIVNAKRNQNGAVQPVSMPSGESVLCCIAGPRDLSHYGSWNCFSYRVPDCKVALQCYVILSSLP